MVNVQAAGFSGTLEEQPLPVVLVRLFTSQSTGILKLSSRAGVHQVYFRDGFPVAVALPGSAELLGKVMQEMGVLDDATYKRTLAEPPKQGQRYGSMLIEKHLVTEAQLRLALKAQVRRKLHRLFFLADASFRFEPGQHDQGLQNQDSLRVHPFRAIYHGVRTAWGAERLATALAPIADKAIQCTLDAEALGRYGVGPDDGRVGELLRKGYWALTDLRDASPLPPQPLHALVFALSVTGALSVKTREEVPRLRAPVGDGAKPREAGARDPADFRRTQPPTTRQRRSTLPPAAAAGSPDITTVRQQIQLKAKVVETENLFQVLGVPEEASSEDVKRAYFEAAKRYHPDRLVSMGLESMRAQVDIIFRRVSEAYGTLYDDQRRSQYRAQIGGGGGGEGPQAREQARKIIDAEMSFRRGEIMLRMNDYVGAVREFERAMTDNPEEGEHLAYLSWARLCAKQIAPAEAKDLLQHAIKMSPRCARAHYFLGMCMKEDNDVAHAASMFKKASELDERLIEAERELRLIQMRKERDKNAKKGLFNRFRKSDK